MKHNRPRLTLSSPSKKRLDAFAEKQWNVLLNLGYPRPKPTFKYMSRWQLREHLSLMDTVIKIRQGKQEA